MRPYLNRILFGFVSVIILLSAGISYNFLKPLLTRKDAVTEEEVWIPAQVVVKPIYSLPCQMEKGIAIFGTSVGESVTGIDAIRCRSLCSADDKCELWSLFGEGNEQQACHLLSAFSGVELKRVSKAESGYKHCTFPLRCLLRETSAASRQGDLLIPGVTSPADCALECALRDPAECLFYSLTGEGAEIESCHLHRGFKPGFDPVSGSDKAPEPWYLATYREVSGTNVFGYRSCGEEPSADEHLRRLHALYGFPYEDTGNVDKFSADKFKPSQQLLDLWFYNNNSLDGGPFPVDDVVSPQSECEYGLVAKYLAPEILSLDAVEGLRLTESDFGAVSATLEATNLTKGSDYKLSIPTSLYEGLWVIDLRKLPIGCGVSRKISLDSVNGANSSITLLAGVNYRDYATMKLHTENECDMSLPLLYKGWHPRYSPSMTGFWQDDSPSMYDCTKDMGCITQTRSKLGDTISSISGADGALFNTKGGNVIVVQVDRARFVKIWSFERNKMPLDLVEGNPDPDNWSFRPTRLADSTESYLPPLAWFPIMRGCSELSTCEERNSTSCQNEMTKCAPQVTQTWNSVSNRGAADSFFPIGCNGFTALGEMNLNFTLSVCSRESSSHWVDEDDLCPILTPLSKEDPEGSCVNAWNENEKIGESASWQFNSIKVYKKKQGICGQKEAEMSIPRDTVTEPQESDMVPAPIEDNDDNDEFDRIPSVDDIVMPPIISPIDGAPVEDMLSIDARPIIDDGSVEVIPPGDIIPVDDVQPVMGNEEPAAVNDPANV